MKKFQKYIKRGVVEPLEKLPFHGKAPFKRLLMLDKASIPESSNYVSVHFIKDLPKEFPKYSKLHKHDCDEINLILSEDDKLIYKVQFENEVYEVSSPATIFIPKGVKHSAEVLSGKGIFVCIILQGDYDASK
ncbi:MAG: 2-isopropylmalate synthase [Nanoarchaeota archaeon]|nr:2-isopropylmalate synthase [Nanoarchaeota archaeon]